jgi:integrative and conjugative element protein (TIGR02256 family)
MNRELLVESRAWNSAIAAASIDPMRETGGVLLGWRHDIGVYVHDVLHVPDTRARHTFYLRRHTPASEILEAAVTALPEGSPIGYVGEWHTHPAPTGPSWIDRREIRRISKQSPSSVGLLVCAYNARARTWAPTGLVAHRGRASRADVVLGRGGERWRANEEGVHL